MKELNEADINHISGGDWTIGAGLFLGYVGAFNALTSFGGGLGRGVYDALHTRSNK